MYSCSPSLETGLPACPRRLRPVMVVRRSVRPGDKGQVLVIGALIILALAMISFSVANVGMMVAEKIHLQDTVDASAYSAAVVEARFMNLSAYINRAMIANYDAIAFNDALWATIASHDHGSAVVAFILYGISAIVEAVSLGLATPISMDIDSVADVIRDAVHHPMHELNAQLDETFAQDRNDMNSYIDMYNADFLSMYEGLLFAAMQSSRHEVVKRVAHKMDDEVQTTTVLGLAAETVSYDELTRAVDYVVKPGGRADSLLRSFSDSFREMSVPPEGEGYGPYLLGTVTESSLNHFAAGRARDGAVDGFRQFSITDIISDIVGPLETALDIACEAATLSLADCDAEIQLNMGPTLRDGQEDKADQRHVPVIANHRIREANAWMFGLRIDGVPGSGVLQWAIGQHGYTSGDRRSDVANAANVTISIEKGVPPPERALESMLAGSSMISPGPPTKGLNAINIQIAQLMGVLLPAFLDDHWDGTYDSEPVNYLEIWPPGQGVAEGVAYAAEVYENGKTEDGVPNYDLRTDLADTGFINYNYPGPGILRPPGNSRGSDRNHLIGPSVAVVGVKPANKVNGLKGLNIHNSYDLTALSRAQVYYLRSPNRPDETPNSFNPYWAARLAPLDSPETPQLLSDGLPYVGSIGLPVAPTR